MCLLWVLLQFVVLAMYWDVPPISSEAGAVMVEMKQEEEGCGDEEAPLIGADVELRHTYRAVNTDQLESSTCSSETQPADGASAASDPFKNFSVSRGEASRFRLPARSNGCQLCSVGGAQVARGVTTNALVWYLLY